jgi:hypothetical protein
MEMPKLHLVLAYFGIFSRCTSFVIGLRSTHHKYEGSTRAYLGAYLGAYVGQIKKAQNIFSRSVLEIFKAGREGLTSYNAT